MDWVEVEGATKEEVEAKALKILGAARIEDLETEEVKVTRRFLGVGGKTYKIRARLKKGAEAPEEAPAPEEVFEEEEEAPAPEEEAYEPVGETPAPPPDEIVTMESRYRPWVSGGEAGVLIPRKGRGYGRRLYNSEPFAEEEREPAVRVEEEEEPYEAPGGEAEFEAPELEDAEDSPISEETRTRAVEFVRQVLSDMGMEAETKGYRLADRLMIQIHTEDGGLLIGRKGETLESLQYLLDIIINRKLEHRVRIVLDAENYRERRKQAVFQKARKAAEDAVRTRRPYPLAPMSPAERRLVHVALAGDRRVETRSEGEGARRRVVIHPVGAPAKKGAPPWKKGGGAGGGKGFKPRRRRQ